MRGDLRNVELWVTNSNTYSQWNKTKDQLREPLLHETFVLIIQTIIEGVQSIASDADVQSTTSTTPEEHDETETLTRKEGCHNPSLGLATKAKGLQGCGPRRRLESHITCSQECKECEGMNLHTPK